MTRKMPREWQEYNFPDINQVLSRMKTVLKKPDLIDLELPESIAYMKKDFYGFKPVKRRPWPEKYPPSQLNEKSKEKTDEEEFTEERTFKIKPNTKTTLKREERTSDYTQEVTAAGLLDAAITIDSDWDFSARAASFSQLQRLIQGGYVPGAKIDGHINNEHLTKFFQQRKFENYHINLAPLHVEVKNTLEYRNVSGTDSERIDTPINKMSIENAPKFHGPAN